MAFNGTDDGLDVSLDIELDDPGSLDELAASIDWGDGTTEPATRSTLAASRAQFTGAHSYDAAGTYDIEVCGTDDDDGKSCRTQAVVLSANETTTTTTSTTTRSTTDTVSPTTDPPTTAPPVSPSVNAKGVTRRGATGGGDAGGPLPRTGTEAVPFALAGLAFILLGSLLLLSRRFLRSQGLGGAAPGRGVDSSQRD